MRFFKTMMIVSCLLFSSICVANAQVHTIVPGEIAPKPWRVPASMVVKVVDEQEQPVADAKVTFNLRGRYQDPETNVLNIAQETVTDKDGRAEITIDSDLNGKIFNFSRMTVNGGGVFLPARQDWDSRTKNGIPIRFVATEKQAVPCRNGWKCSSILNSKLSVLFAMRKGIPSKGQLSNWVNCGIVR